MISHSCLLSDWREVPLLLALSYGVASVFASFNIELPEGAFGENVRPEIKMSSGLLSYVNSARQHQAEIDLASKQVFQSIQIRDYSKVRCYGGTDKQPRVRRYSSNTRSSFLKIRT